MNVATRFGTLAVALAATASAGYSWGLNRELGALEKRVGALTSQLAQVRESCTNAGSVAPPTPEFRVQAAVAPIAPIAPVPEAKIREVVLGEFVRREEEQRLATEADLELQVDRLRDSLSRQLELDADTLAQLETLGDELATIERSLLAENAAGQISEAEMRSRYFRAWTATESKLKQRLGDARHQKLATARREHPEFARSFYVLRAAPANPDQQDNP